jgi:hypothetical protein
MKKIINRLSKRQRNRIAKLVYDAYVENISWEYAAMQLIDMYNRALHNSVLMSRGKRKNGR